MLKGKTALITGSSRGIGAATATLLAANGANVIINYSSDSQTAEELVKKITAAGGNAIAIQADVSDEKSVQAMFAKAAEKYGHVDILVNNAANSVKQIKFKELTNEELQKSFDVIVKGAANCCRHAIPHMESQKYGKIINVATIYTEGNIPTSLAHYVCAKYALVGLTKALAAEYGPAGIRVNSVSPGLTETKMTEDLPDALKQIVARQTPLRRIGQPEDIAKTILFLAGPDSDFITGLNIPICGGLVM